jgi:hypothetical protein
MAKFDARAILSDIKAYRRVYFLTAVASFGGMVSSNTAKEMTFC